MATSDDEHRSRLVTWGRLILAARYNGEDLVELNVQIDPEADSTPGGIRQSELASLPLTAMARSVRYGVDMPTWATDQGAWNEQTGSWQDRRLSRFKVTRPDRTTAWRKRFAEVYRAASLETSKPAKLIATVSGVPVSAVHRWAHEARLRGDLPTAPHDEQDDEQ